MFDGLLQGGRCLGIQPLAQLNRPQFVEISGLARLFRSGLFQFDQFDFISADHPELSTHHHRNDGEQANQAQEVGLGQ